MDAFSMKDRRVLIIGGTRGIGRAIAIQLARSGASVIANYVRDARAAERFASDVASEGLSVEVVKADVTSERGITTISETVARFGGLHSLVFAAATGVHRPFEQLTSRHFDFTFALNVKAFLTLVQTLSPHMRTGATIVALSSEGAVHAVPQYHLVGASKGALEALARSLASELAGRGIRVNILAPGAVETDVWKALPDAAQRLAAVAARSPRNRLNSLEEVALAAQFLASDASAGLIGHTLVVDGGARIMGVG
jgi:enoyl-[acyl-carrier protein] reductase III